MQLENTVSLPKLPAVLSHRCHITAPLLGELCSLVVIFVGTFDIIFHCCRLFAIFLIRLLLPRVRSTPTMYRAPCRFLHAEDKPYWPDKHRPSTHDNHGTPHPAWTVIAIPNRQRSSMTSTRAQSQTANPIQQREFRLESRLIPPPPPCSKPELDLSTRT